MDVATFCDSLIVRSLKGRDWSSQAVPMVLPSEHCTKISGVSGAEL